MKLTKYLIVDAMTGDARTTKKRPTRRFGEVVYRLHIEIPDRWNDVLGDITLSLPEPPADAVVVHAEDNA